jgi:hypothetical protein
LDFRWALALLQNFYFFTAGRSLIAKHSAARAGKQFYRLS